MTSSDTTPVWGPQLPRLKRIRERTWLVPDNTFGSQSRNGITHVEANWIYTKQHSGLLNRERCEDTRRNPKFRFFKPPKFFDDGGPLNIRRSIWTFNDPAKGTITPWVGNTRQLYGLVSVRTIILDGGFNIGSDYPPLSDGDLSSYHATAYKLLRPDRPGVDLFTAIVELRDILGLQIKAIRELKDIGDWWLAVQFGWKPLLNDIIKTVKTIIALDERLRFIIRNNGLAVRRHVKKVYEESYTQNLTNQPGNIGISRNTYVDWPGRSSRSSSWFFKIDKTYTRKVWASGSFVMWFGDITLPKQQKFIQMGLLGLNPSPAAVWNALPWSWLVDWISNVGDILDNMSSTLGDRLVANYAYIMGKTTREYTWSGTDGYYDASCSHSYETLKREVIHPYGLAFGAALSNTQLSILAALGSQKF